MRIEDIDGSRSRAEIAAGQREDLAWLGITWDEEVPPQSARAYDLRNVPHYYCDCNRAARLAGGCRCRDQAKAKGAVRFRVPPGDVVVNDRAAGQLRLPPGDDPVLIGVDGRPMYTLAVVTDDARDGVTEVVRGADLLGATPAQIRLHEALGLPIPTYLHIPVLNGPDGKKLSKSHGAMEIASLRRVGTTPSEIWQRLLPLLGCAAGPLGDARFDAAAVPEGPFIINTDG